MNISQTMVAVMTAASLRDEVDAELLADVSSLLEGATRAEVVSLIASLANVNDFALTLLETHTSLTRAGFLQDLGRFFVENPEES